jgi:hypothetical protein
MADGKKKKITRQGAQRVTNFICQAAMIPSAILGFVGGAAYFGTLDADPMKPIMVSTLSP